MQQGGALSSVVGQRLLIIEDSRLQAYLTPTYPQLFFLFLQNIQASSERAGAAGAASVAGRPLRSPGAVAGGRPVRARLRQGRSLPPLFCPPAAGAVFSAFSCCTRWRETDLILLAVGARTYPCGKVRMHSCP